MPPPRTAQAFPVVIPVEQALRRLKLFPSSDVCPETLISAFAASEDSKSPAISLVISDMMGVDGKVGELMRRA